MAHMIDMSNGRANMAYKGAVPWHGLGQELVQGASIEEWTKAAGLDWSCMSSMVQFNAGRTFDDIGAPIENTMLGLEDRHVLYRSDTKDALGLVSSRYKPVQPTDIFKFFNDICHGANFDMETAGSLKGGAVIWAMAKAGEGSEIADGDVVTPYVLLATSFDGSIPTIAKFTAVRVVCNNTISMALSKHDKGATVKTRHSTHFHPDVIARKLGIVTSAFTGWMEAAQSLANKKISADDADGLLLAILRANGEDVAELKTKREQDATAQDDGTSFAALIGDTDTLRKSKEYKRIMGLYEGEAIGSELVDGGNRWGMLNAVTQYVDHDRVKHNDRRMQAAWFGKGDELKTTALDILLTK